MYSISQYVLLKWVPSIISTKIIVENNSNFSTFDQPANTLNYIYPGMHHFQLGIKSVEEMKSKELHNK